ncbi:YoaK family protein [Aspergillus undulatus]|uniref:YoaK family protein n=1 Tax=Aspergillus undulatus TaxID=1810928 RepID=UPI003CCE0136
MTSSTRRHIFSEYSSLLGHPQPTTNHASFPLHHRAVAHLKTNINPSHTSLLLLFSYMLTGLLDSSAVFIWGSFASMQTGNTVYLGLGAMGADPSSPARWVKAGTSIGSFCVGSLAFSAFYRWSREPRGRWVLACSFLIQLVCIAVAATIVMMARHRSDSSKSRSELDWGDIIPLALVAFQSSGQAVSSRVLDRKSLTSVVLTSVYCDLFSIPIPAGGKGGAEDWKRAGAIGCLIVGVVMGGLWAKTEIGTVGALWTVVFGKALIVLAWLVWDGVDEEET